MLKPELSFLCLLGSSYPADGFVDTELKQRLGKRFTPYSAFIARHMGGTHVSKESLRLAALQAELALHAERSVVIVGRSSGAIVAARAAAMGCPQIAAIIALGYPFEHPDRGDEPKRYRHLPRVSVPFLIFQGERDRYGTPDGITRYALSESTLICPVNADHAFRLAPDSWDEVAHRITALAEADAQDDLTELTLRIGRPPKEPKAKAG